MKRIAKQIITLLMCVALLLGDNSLSTFAAEVSQMDASDIIEEEVIDVSGDDVTTYDASTPLTFSYTVNPDGVSATITGLSGRIDGDLVIPDEIDGYTVVAIGDGTWSIGMESSCSGGLIIPDTVTTLNRGAFGDFCFRGGLTLSKTLAVIGECAFGGCHFSGELLIPESVIVIEEGAFNYCDGFTGDLVIPDTVTFIGEGAFGDCSGFDGNLVISNSVTSIEKNTFYRCSGLQGVTMGKLVTSIADHAFAEMPLVKDIKFSSNVSYIDMMAFSGRGSDLTFHVEKGSYAHTYAKNYLINYEFYNSEKEENAEEDFTWDGSVITGYVGEEANVVIPERATKIGDEAFKDSDVISVSFAGDRVTEIGKYAFANSRLSRISLPESLEVIDNGAFNLTHLTEITIPENVTKINEKAFAAYDYSSSWNGYSHSYLSEVTFEGNNIIRIGDNAFYNQNIETITIPDSVTSIGANAFARNPLTSLVIPENVTFIGSEAFGSCTKLSEVKIFAKNLTSASRIFSGSTISKLELNESMTKLPEWMFYDAQFSYTCTVSIPENIATLGTSCFYDSSIENVEMQEGIKKIGNLAFYNCEQLKEINIPNSVDEIGSSAFSGCKRLKNISFGKITGINYRTFYGCESLDYVVLPSSITSIGEEAFSSCIDLSTIVVPVSVSSISDDAFLNCDVNFTMHVKRGSYAHNYAVSKNIRYELVDETGEEEEPEETPESAFTWDGTIVTGYKGNSLEITIPAKATAIGDEAFKGSKVTKVVFLGNKVTEIGRYAFAESDLMSIDLPDSLVVINNNAFYDTKLISIIIPKNVEKINTRAFSAKGYPGGTLSEVIFAGNKVVRIGDEAFYYQRISDLVLPESVTYIGASAFADSDIAEIIIPQNVTKLGGWCFGGCKNLRTIYINSTKLTNASMPFVEDKISEVYLCDGMTSIPYGLFHGTTFDNTIIDIPSNVVKIESSAFYSESKYTINFNGSKLKEIGSSAFSGGRFYEFSIPQSVEIIRDSAFANCINLKKIILPSSINYLENNAFTGCESLETINIPYGVKEIYGGAFANCTELSSAYIPSSVKSIYNNAFINCDIDFTMYVVKDSYAHQFAKNNNIPYKYYDETVYEDEQFQWSGTTITKYIGKSTIVTIPAKATAIGDSAFNGSGISSITFLGNNITSIGNSAFANCNFEEIIIPSSVKKIEQAAFSFCYNLKEINLPNSVNEIGYSAFYGCTSMTKAYIPASVTKIGSDAFGYHNSDLVLYVVSGTVGYKYAVDNKHKLATTYHIYYKLDSGENNPENIDFWDLGDIAAIKEPTRNGYSFEGWYYDSSFTKLVPSMITCEGDVTIYAKWRINKYKITYDYDGGGLVSNPTSYNVTSEITLISPKKNGFKFDGWFDQYGNKLTKIVAGTYGDLSLTAHWTEYTYTLKFFANNGVGYMDSQTLCYTEESPLLANCFERLGYLFAGWNTKADGTGSTYADEEVVARISSKNNEVISLYAQWTLDTYYIVYDLNEGTQNSKNKNSYTIKTAVSLYSPSRVGYTFGGWYKNADLSGAKVTSIPKGSAGDVYLYAKWIENKYKVVFSLNGSNVVGSVSNVTTGYFEDFVLPDEGDITRNGYTLVGWGTKASGGTVYEAGDAVSELVSTNNGAITLYAQWKADDYNICYYNVEEANNSANKEIYNITQKVTFKNPVWTGYTFKGWYDNEDYEGYKITTIKKGSTGDRDFYARWSENSYKLVFNKNSGTLLSALPAAQTYMYTDGVDLPGEIVSRKGYWLSGWNTKANGTGTHYDLEDTVSGILGTNGKTATLYAEWTAIQYDLYYELDGGVNNVANKDYHTSVADMTLKNPTKTGYTFKGWYTSADFKSTTKITKVVKSEDPVTVYAKWQANTYKIAFNKNGGAGTMATITATYDVEKSLPVCKFAKSGKSFVGWNTKANGSGTFYYDEEEVINLTSTNGKIVTLYAIWE